MWGRRLGPALAAAVLLLGIAAPARADQLTQEQQQQQQLQDQYNQRQGRITSLEAQKAAAEAQLRTLDAQIAAQESAVASENARIDALLGHIDDTQRDLQAKRAEQAQRQVILDHRTRTLYKEEGAVSFINALFTSSDFSQLLDRFIVMRDITHSDQLLLQQIKDARTQIEADLAGLQKDRADQQALLDQMKQQEAALNRQYAQENALRASIAGETATLQQQQAANIKARAQVASEIAALIEARKHAHSSGTFAWPGVQGPITQGFGCTDYSAEPPPPAPYSCPPSRPYFHYGIDIGGPWGSEITAADGGTAYTYVSSYGYGLHVIIVHANGYATLYGHMSSFAISSGQSVAKGQAIGYEGSTGNSSGPHLHFEIDLNGSPVNPCNYVGC